MNLRTCEVNGIPGHFHCWQSYSDVVKPSIMKGGHPGGTVQYCLGIVEFEDGSVDAFFPEEIKFTDGRLEAENDQ